MSALSHRSCLTIKLSYVLISTALLLNFISEAHSLNFKFIISSIVILVFCALFVCSVLQKGFIIIYSAIIIIGVLYILNLVFIVSSFMNSDLWIFSVQNLSYLSPVAYLILLSGLIYLIINNCVCFTSPAEKKILKLFIAFLLSLIITERIISLSIPRISNIVLGVIFMFILTEYLGIGVKSYYSGEKKD